MAPDPLVACVILNTNRRDDTLACLASVRANGYRNCRPLVLDCHSTDGSADAVRSSFPDVDLVQLEENRGYAGNNNVGIRLALGWGADWVFVLNEDTVLDPRCVERLVEAGERDPAVGILGPMVYHFDEPGVIQSAGGHLNARWDATHDGQNEPDRGQFGEPRLVDWISGCAILVRRGVVAAVGALDERFFYYWEETEWCLRAGKAGWRVMHVPAARVWHKGVTRDYRPQPAVTYYATRNRLLLLSLHQAPVRVRASAWLQLCRTMVSWSVRPKWRQMRPHRDAMWRGIGDFVKGRTGRMPG